ncbi:MAG: RHS repeat protein, partial [Planctomycetes bacterium]|nr:RHS repeat protein [Planctomycetota bacterium]
SENLLEPGAIRSWQSDPLSGKESLVDEEGQRSETERKGLEITTRLPDGRSAVQTLNRDGLAVLNSEGSGNTAIRRGASGEVLAITREGLGEERFAPSGFGRASRARAADGTESLMELTAQGELCGAKEAVGSLDERETRTREETAARRSWVWRGPQGTCTRRDAAGRPVQVDYYYEFGGPENPGPLDHSEALKYHSRGMLASRTLPSGCVLLYDYDSRLRPTAVREGERLLRSFADYNDFGEPQTLTEYGENGTVVLSRSYDARGRLAGETSLGRSLHYSYDLKGRVQAILYPAIGEVRFGYSVGGRLASVEIEGERVLEIDFSTAAHKMPEMVKFIHEGSLTAPWAYRLGYKVLGAPRLDAIEYLNLSPFGASQPVVKHQFKENTDLIERTRQWSDGSSWRVYAYDPLQRLKGVTPGTDWDAFADSSYHLDPFENLDGAQTVDGQPLHLTPGQRNQIT